MLLGVVYLPHGDGLELAFFLNNGATLGLVLAAIDGIAILRFMMIGFIISQDSLGLVLLIDLLEDFFLLSGVRCLTCWLPRLPNVGRNEVLERSSGWEGGVGLVQGIATLLVPLSLRIGVDVVHKACQLPIERSMWLLVIRQLFSRD